MSSSDSQIGVLKLLIDAPPTVLYHYTSMEGLLGIVRSGNVWASDSRYLNDTTDSTYLISVLKNHVAKRITAASGSDKKAYEELLSELEKPNEFDVFVASFSANGDLLSQWRAYCPGGIGFSIGFDSNALRTGYVSDLSADKPHFVSGQLTQVRYLGSEADASADEILKECGGFANALLSTMGNLVPPVLVSLAEATAKSAAVFAPIFKDLAFAEEQEWRLVLSKIPGPMPGKRFRAGKSTLVPYVDAEPLGKEGYFIKEVIVGPTPHPELSVEAVIALFQSVNHPEVAIRASKVPYRHW